MEISGDQRDEFISNLIRRVNYLKKMGITEFF